MMSFPAFPRLASDRITYIIKRKLHGGVKIGILFSHVKNNILLIYSRRRVISSIGYSIM